MFTLATTPNTGGGGLDLSFFVPPDPLQTALVAGIIPGVLMTVVLLVIWLRKRDDAEQVTLRWLLPLAFIGVAVWAEAAIRQWPSQWLPPQVGGRFIHLALGIGLGGLASALIRPKWLGVAMGVAIAGVAIIAVLLEPALRPGRNDLTSALLHSGGLLIVLSALIPALNGAHKHEPGWVLPAAAMPAFGLAGPVLVLAGTAPAAQLSAILPALLGAAVLVALLRPSLSLARGGWTVIVAWHAGLILYNTFWGWNNLTPLSASLLAIAPLGAACVALPKIRNWHPLARVAIGASASALTAMLALVMAYRVAAAASAGAYY